VKPKPLPHRPLEVTLPVEVAVADEEVLVLVEETRVESVLGFPTELDASEVVDEQVPNRESHPAPQHPVELPQYCSTSKLANIVCNSARCTYAIFVAAVPKGRS
jgi:hypothetical protein